MISGFLRHFFINETLIGLCCIVQEETIAPTRQTKCDFGAWMQALPVGTGFLLYDSQNFSEGGSRLWSTLTRCKQSQQRKRRTFKIQFHRQHPENPNVKVRAQRTKQRTHTHTHKGRWRAGACCLKHWGIFNKKQVKTWGYTLKEERKENNASRKCEAKN